MKETGKKIGRGLVLMLMLAAMASMTVLAADGDAPAPAMYATFASLVPPVVAIVLALITKEVYSSLFVGILVGGLFYSGFQFEGGVCLLYGGRVGVRQGRIGRENILDYFLQLGVCRCVQE